MGEAENNPGWELLDWTEVRVQPLPVDGFMLFISGVTPVPMDVELHPLPIGIVPEDYRVVEVRGYRREVGPDVETRWSTNAETKEFGGAKIGFMLKGATMREYVPPKEEAEAAA